MFSERGPRCDERHTIQCDLETARSGRTPHGMCSSGSMSGTRLGIRSYARRLRQLERLGLEILVESVLPELAPVARLLHAAEGRVRVERRAVDVDLRGANPPGDPRGASSRPATRRRRRVRRSCRWRSGRRRPRRRTGGSYSTGPKISSCAIRHPARHVREHGRARRSSRARSPSGGSTPAGDEPRALVDAGLDVAAHALALARRHERSEPRLRRSADRRTASSARAARRELDRLVADARAAPASASTPRRSGRELMNAWFRLARTAFSKSASSRITLADLPPSSSETFFTERAASSRDAPPAAVGAGERDHVDVGMRRPAPRPRRTRAGDEVEHARRQSASFTISASMKHDERHDLARLQHHACSPAASAGPSFATIWCSG